MLSARLLGLAFLGLCAAATSSDAGDFPIKGRQMVPGRRNLPFNRAARMNMRALQGGGKEKAAPTPTGCVGKVANGIGTLWNSVLNSALETMPYVGPAYMRTKMGKAFDACMKLQTPGEQAEQMCNLVMMTLPYSMVMAPVESIRSTRNADKSTPTAAAKKVLGKGVGGVFRNLWLHMLQTMASVGVFVLVDKIASKHFAKLGLNEDQKLGAKIAAALIAQTAALAALNPLLVVQEKLSGLDPSSQLGCGAGSALSELKALQKKGLGALYEGFTDRLAAGYKLMFWLNLNPVLMAKATAAAK